MGLGSIWVVLVVIFCGLGVGKWILKRVNWWLYEAKLGAKKDSLPPGDLGWPFIGNMWSFLIAFKSSDPDSFIRSFVNRYLPSFPPLFPLYIHIHVYACINPSINTLNFKLLQINSVSTYIHYFCISPKALGNLS